MLSLDVELQRLKLSQLAQSGNIKALQRIRETRQYAEAAWDALIAIQAARNNDWALLSWVIQAGLPTVLGFSECCSISDREPISARQALYYKHHPIPLPPRAQHLLPSFRAAFAKRAAADAEMLRQKTSSSGRTSEEDVLSRSLAPGEYVFMEPDASTAAFLQGHLDMMNWLLQRAGGLRPGHPLFRHGIIYQALSVPAPFHSIEWLITQGTFRSSYTFSYFLVEALCAAASLKRHHYLQLLSQHYGATLDAERKAQVLWFCSTFKCPEALEVLTQLAPWQGCSVPNWPLEDREEED